MINIKKISALTKLLSNRYYLSEVPVEGRRTRKFYFNIGWNDLYAQQIIRAGNCCTLLSSPMDMTEDNFWKASHFDDFVRYVFWTFKDFFLAQILEKMTSLRSETLAGYSDLLEKNLTPFEGELPADADEELKWCWVKNANLRKSDQYARMYLLDQQNRSAVLHALEQLMQAPAQSTDLSSVPASLTVAAEVEGTVMISFPEMLVPIDGSVENTLQFIKEKLEEAEFKFSLFSPVSRLKVNKNPYGFNGCLAAMIDFFYQHRYFKNEFTLEEVFIAHLAYSGNGIGKFKVFLSEFRQNNSYREHFAKLKSLKIKSLH